MKQKLLLVFIMMATWIVVSCTTTSQNGKGCYGFWEGNRWGLKRGTIVGKNANYKKPYRQCVDENNKGTNLKERRYL